VSISFQLLVSSFAHKSYFLQHDKVPRLERRAGADESRQDVMCIVYLDDYSMSDMMTLGSQPFSFSSMSFCHVRLHASLNTSDFELSGLLALILIYLFLSSYEGRPTGC
jgi:hypothetical protein